jgi:hypothetical protein
LPLKAQEHPCLLNSKQSIREMQLALNENTLWANLVNELQSQVDMELVNPFDVPVPKDPGGGYTHNKHKSNAKLLKNLGLLYLITSNEKYAEKAKELFLLYAKLYPTLGEHPVKKSYAPGRLFWQQLNEAVWLTDAIQGYDAIYNYLPESDKKNIEKNLLLPFADFLSIENPEVFNRIHNHGVWAVAAVGMTGIALNNNELICRAFYGIDAKGKPKASKIDKNLLLAFSSGFFKQTASLFSPDGYYTEGPYYQRYAMTPFLLFAESMQNNIPQIEVLKFHDEIFNKAVEILIQLTDKSGQFLPINDNLKGMSLMAPEVQAAISFLYVNTKNPELLSLIDTHNLSLVSSLGLVVMNGLKANAQKPLKQHSKLISDGPNGNSGGIGLLRDSLDEFCAVFKFASHGLSHGHFDRLNVFYYQNANQVLTDYGAARFVNFKDKEGGRYLPENESYAKQTIAHNTLVVNQKSNFNFKLSESEKYNPELLFSDLSDKNMQIICAQDTAAYSGINMTRVIALIDNAYFINPIVVDVFNVKANNQSQTYDLPFHFIGQVLNSDFACTVNINRQEPLGKTDGYQHIWHTATGKTDKYTTGFTWLNNNIIYSLSTIVDTNSTLMFGMIGANDPDFNLRNEPVFIVRQKNASNHTFVNIIESHGTNNPNTEVVSNQTKQVKNIALLKSDADKIVLQITTNNNEQLLLLSLLQLTEPRRRRSRSYAWL